MQGDSALSADEVGRLLDAAPDPIVVLDGRGRIQLVNQQATVLFGRPREALVGRDVRVLLPEWDEWLGWTASAVDGQVLSGTVGHSTGRQVPVELAIRSLHESEDGPVGVFLRDISGRLALEQQADRARDELIANISHELRTPLTSMMGYLELLSDLGPDELGPQGRRLVEIIARSATRELRLVNDLLTVSFADEHLSRMAVEPVDLTALAVQVVEEYQPTAEGAGLEIAVDAASPVVVRGDADHLARVIENLVTNSIKFSPPGGRVRVRVAVQDGEATLVVVDNGIGVSEAEQGRLFDRMYRAPGAIERQAEGAGLGLSIVKAIIEAHGGTVAVQSTLGAGTSISVTLPGPPGRD